MQLRLKMMLSVVTLLPHRALQNVLLEPGELLGQLTGALLWSAFMIADTAAWFPVRKHVFWACKALGHLLTPGRMACSVAHPLT